ncbi:MAG: hypothetical protein PVF28_03055, partial [Thioalkalispiraceae bacterium]
LHKLSKHNVHDPQMQTRRKSTINEKYLQTLLLYLAEPYHLRPGEINQVHRQLENWSALCQLQKYRSISKLEQTRLPIVELNSDRPPRLNLKDASHDTVDHYRVLDTSSLIMSLKKMRKQLIKHQSTSATSINNETLSISLVRRLIESWEHSRQRRFPRQQMNAEVNVTIGLHHAHMQLMYEQHLKETEQSKSGYSGFYQQPAFEAIEIKGIEDEHSDVWSTVYSWANSLCPGSSQSTPATQARANPKSITEYRVKQDNWTLVNESAEGLGLLSNESPKMKVQVGEVISVQRKNSIERSIGLVRWMRTRESHGIELGVMLIAPTAKPVGLILDDPAKGDYVIDRGLLLPPMAMFNRPESLLTFSRQYRPGDNLRINRPGAGNVWIKLVKLIADNGSISQYLFTQFQHKEIDRHDSEHAGPEDYDQFNDIWQSV